MIGERTPSTTFPNGFQYFWGFGLQKGEKAMTRCGNGNAQDSCKNQHIGIILLPSRNHLRAVLEPWKSFLATVLAFKLSANSEAVLDASSAQNETSKTPQGRARPRQARPQKEVCFAFSQCHANIWLNGPARLASWPG